VSYLEPHKISSEVSRELNQSTGTIAFYPRYASGKRSSFSRKREFSSREILASGSGESKEELNLTEVPLSWEVAHELRFTMLGYRESSGPGFLVATAKVYDLRLVTADERLLGVAGIQVLANR